MRKLFILTFVLIPLIGFAQSKKKVINSKRSPAKKQVQQSKHSYTQQSKSSQSRTYEWAPFIEEQNIIVCAKGGKPRFELLGGATKPLNEYISLGAGIGASTDFHSSPLMPLFARLSVEKRSADLSPLFMLDAGYDFNFQEIKLSNVRLNPTFGIKTGGFYIGVGYLAHIPTQKEADVIHNVNIKLGFEFNHFSKNSSVRKSLNRFFGQTLPNFVKNKTYAEINLGGGIGLSSENIEGENTTIGNNMHLEAAWMYQGTEKWDIGIGLGYRHYFINSHEDDVKYKLHSIPLYLRNKFYVIPEMGELKPFIGFDMGLNMVTVKGIIENEKEIRNGGKLVGYEDIEEKESSTKFMLRPQVGVLYKNKFSATLSYMHSSLDGVNDESRSLPSIDLAIGIRLW